MIRDSARTGVLPKLRNYETVEQAARFRCRGFDEIHRAKVLSNFGIRRFRCGALGWGTRNLMDSAPVQTKINFRVVQAD